MLESVLLRRRKHRQQFFNAIDESKLRNFLEKGMKSAGFLATHSIGSGRNFQTILWQQPGLMELAISLRHPNLDERDSQSHDLWSQRVRWVGQKEWPLVPPMTPLRLEENHWAYIKPFAPDKASDSELKSAEMQTMKQELKKNLHDHKLYLDDLWQIQLREGVPYIIDWSDLESAF